MNASRRTSPDARLLAALALLACAFSACAAETSPALAEESVTAQDQSEAPGDRAVTQDVRKAVMSSDRLSFKAKNVTIVTVNGNVTLRGRVPSDAERREIESIARSAAPAGVSNEVEVDK